MLSECWPCSCGPTGTKLRQPSVAELGLGFMTWINVPWLRWWTKWWSFTITVLHMSCDHTVKWILNKQQQHLSIDWWVISWLSSFNRIDRRQHTTKEMLVCATWYGVWDCKRLPTNPTKHYLSELPTITITRYSTYIISALQSGYGLRLEQHNHRSWLCWQIRGHHSNAI